MALFGSKKKKTEDTAAKLAAVSIGSNNLEGDVILRPRITEKTHTLAEGSNVFIFDVVRGSSKGKVADAIKSLYKVTPIKVSVVPIPRKKRTSRGRIAYTGGGRKAYVYLKKGEKLELQ